MKERPSRNVGEGHSRGNLDKSAAIPNTNFADSDQLDLNERSSRSRLPRLAGLGGGQTRLLASLVVIQLLMAMGQAAIINCATNCKSCWGSGATMCMTCDPGYIMMNFSCLTTATGCDAGYRLDTRDNICKRTINDIDYPCEPSTYNQNTGATSDLQCQTCAPGASCETFALEASSSDCLAGYYCRTGSTLRSPLADYAADFSTPYTPIAGITNWWNINQITDASVPPLIQRNGDVCKQGNFCGATVSTMKTCYSGHYCPDDFMKAHDATLTCRQGFYCKGGSDTMTPGNPKYALKPTMGDICRVGYYCPTTSSKQFACDPGYFMPYEMADEQTDCINCPEGKYCGVSNMSDLTTQDCEAGYYCAKNAINARQNACGYDEICTTGTLFPEQCAPEEYTPTSKASTCTTCNAGKRCKAGSVSDCEAGTYCSGNTVSYCPPGKYGQSLDVGMSTEGSACTNCETGYACLQPNLRFQCAAGWHCTGNAEFRVPNGKAGEGGDICPPKTYCETGSLTKTDCNAGLYCPNWAASSTADRCYAGYYCPIGSEKPNQNVCQPGHYCPLGATQMSACPEGTYNEGAGAESSQACKKCPEGVQCLGTGLAYAPIFISADGTKTDVCSVNNTSTNPTYQCDAGVTTCPKGQFCPRGTGSNNVDKKDCDKGFYCPGTRAQLVCQAGYYQDTTGQAACKLCGSSSSTLGYYCDGTNPDREGTLCKAGRYCPPGTAHIDDNPCPAGTYNPSTGSRDAAACLQCKVGYYCQFLGLSSVTTPIAQRYHGNNQPGWKTPEGAGLCPQTAYCEEGTADAVPCPNGQWTPSLGASSLNDCIPCPRGKYCKFTDMFADPVFIAFKASNPSFTITQLETLYTNVATYWANCDDGYICLEGSTSPQPSTAQEGYECPQGHHCPQGSIIEIPCPPGYRQPNTKQPNCLGCAPGTYCGAFSMLVGTQCDEGSYCPGTNDVFPGSATFIQIRATPCPVGSYGAPLGSDAVGDCKPCENGKFCDTPGQLVTGGLCDSGFVCLTGNDRPGPYVAVFNGANSGKTDVGYFSEPGSSTQTACPSKFYSVDYQSSQCLSCPPGNYCTGGSSRTLCADGYYCREESNTPQPKDGVMGNLCPANNYCFQGSGIPHSCLDGTRQPSTGQSSCKACEIGSICTNGGVMTTCPQYHFCDGNTEYPLGKLCDNGFYGLDGVTGMVEAANCTACPQAVFCTSGRIVGDCAPGFICVEQADSHTPMNDTLADKAYPCPLGFYCNEGAQEPTKCPPATFTFEIGAKQETECTICQAGWYCPYEGTEPVICPAGAYCGFSSFEPTYCPEGTYQPFDNKGHANDCLPCKAGYNCYEKGIGNLVSAGDKYKCPEGHYCPSGINIKPVKCIAGSYLDSLTSPTQAITFEQVFIGGSTNIADNIEDCSFCPRGYTCPPGTGYRYSYPCPPKYLCPAGSGFPVLCPAGFYCEGTGKGLKESEECPEGYFCAAGTDIPKACGEKEVCPKKSAGPAVRGLKAEDCEPGTYLNVDDCFTCEPGFVCVYHTTQKYPISLEEEGGYECPVGHYCPRGTTEETIKKCPAGTHRRETRGKTIEDCGICPDNSAQSREGSNVCVLCGRGSESSKDRSTCNCVGAFRTWQESTNECVCQAGYFSPVITEQQQTSTQDLDCKPRMEPICPESQFVNEENQCISKDLCETSYYCNGEGGFYDSELDNCFCDNVSNEPEFYCNSECQFESLKVFYTKDDKIEMMSAGRSRTFNLEDFGENFFFAGMECPIRRCQLMSQKFVDGKMVASEEASQDFVDFWREKIDPGYLSPYPEERRRRMNAYYFPNFDSLYVPDPKTKEVDNSFMRMYEKGQTTTSLSLEELNKNYPLSTAKFQLDPLPQPADSLRDDIFDPQEDFFEPFPDFSGTGQFIEQSIQCIEPSEGVSFEVNPINFPVYIIDSKYNTNQNYDYGPFSQLEVRLNGAKLGIQSFAVNFNTEGVYVFGDHATPSTPQTVVYVTKSKENTCEGRTQWPLTSTNMKKFGIVKQETLMRQFDDWLFFIPYFFLVFAFVVVGLQWLIESRIEAAELERRLRREKASATLKKYFKKKQDKFDKVEYLADMYKMIQLTLDEIKKQIAENKRRTEQENHDNMNRMLKDKYSVMKDLQKSGANKDLEAIQKKVASMLTNLRFSDGRTLEQVVEAMKMQTRLEEEQEKLNAMQEKEKHDKLDRSSDSFVSEAFSDEDLSQDSFVTKSSKDASKDDDAEKEEEQEQDPGRANASLADDMLAHKAALRKKREEFIASMDPNLSTQLREEMIKNFDQNMTLIAASIQKEQQDQDARLQAKLNARRRKDKKVIQDANKEVQDKQMIIAEIQDRVDHLVVDKEKIKDKGVNTKTLKAERDEEYAGRMETLDKEQEEKVKALRDDYLKRIKEASNPAEKDKLLEEMGKRLKSVEANLLEEKKRQEAQLQKMLKARQKKNLKQNEKNMDKEIDELEDQIDKLKQNMDTDKAQIYAEKGNVAGLLDHDVTMKKNKIANSLDNKFSGFQNELTQVEKDDIEIHKTQLQLEKEKELNSAETEIDSEVNKSDQQKDLLEEKEKLRLKLDETADPNEKERLMAQLSELESSLARQMAADLANQDRDLDAKRKKRHELLQLKKMQIEADQIDELNKKEVETINNKFMQQVNDMDKHLDKDLDREVRTIVTRVGPGKEQALIVVNEAHDDALERKLKILMSKQFGDLTKYLGSMQNKITMEHMIRTRKVEMKFKNDKEKAVKMGMSEDDLAEKFQMLEAERDLELQLSEQKMVRDREEREQEVRESQEEKFCDEKKELVQISGQLKRRKLQQVMDKMPDNEVVQDVGEKLLRRIDLSIEDEMADADKDKETNLERARMKIIAENEKQIEDMKVSLNAAMEKEEEKLDAQMNARKDQILTLKRQNLEERLKMAGDMTQEQIKELRQQYEREYNNLEKAISEEKAKQLTNMRSAMLSRRIAKERKRRIQVEEEEAARSRASVQKMNTGLAKAFRQMIASKMGGQKSLNTALYVDGEDRLRTRLAAWQRAVDEAKNYRGGEEGEIWNLEAEAEKEKAEKAEAKRLKEQAKAERDTKIAFTVQELYKRVLRVERLSELAEEQGVNVGKIFEGTGLKDLLKGNAEKSSKMGRSKSARRQSMMMNNLARKFAGI